MPTGRVFVVATAGHVDHGKSTLVRALTGTDPDRLEEERRRQMTIDLGFAHLDLPCGRIGMVDVPGHRRFMRNMLAGVHGIDAALLVIAATEGPMPQTREHVGVLSLLGVERGVVAITKCDLVEDDWLELVTEEVAACLDGTTLAGAPVVMTSSQTGQGLEQVAQELGRTLASVPEHDDHGKPRLPVDRAFSLKGFGTVVTGTLAGGSLALGDQPVLLPEGRRVRVRGLQQHNHPVERALPGSRTAVNLVGVQRGEVGRGDTLADPDVLSVTTRLGVRIQVLPDAPAPLRHRTRLLLYHGTTEVGARVLLLEGETLEPGESGLARLRLDAPVAAAVHDRFILRRMTPPRTIAGGAVLDLDDPGLRRRDALSRLTVRDAAEPEAMLLAALDEAHDGLTRPAALGAAGVTEDVLDQALRAGKALLIGGTLMTKERWESVERGTRAVLEDHHREHRLRGGMQREELRSRSGLSRSSFLDVIGELISSGAVVEADRLIALAGHEVHPTASQQAVIDGVLAALGRRPFAPPSLPELTVRYQLTPDIVEYLVSGRLVVRLSKDTLILTESWTEALGRVRQHLEEHGQINAAEARQLVDANRRVLLSLLDWLDSRGETIRRGDEHHAVRLASSLSGPES